MQLTGQYEDQVANVSATTSGWNWALCHSRLLIFIYGQIQQSLENCQQEVARLKVERNLYEENMKKAFMRGVCALNLEAMTMFQNDSDGTADHHAGTGEGHYVSIASHIHDGSETGLEPQFQLGVPATHLKSQAGSSSKCVLVTTSESVPPSSLLGISRHAQTSSNSSKKTIRLVPAVTVEKH